jgi:hypothetical protein
MKDVMNKRCEIAECDKQPNFGLLPRKATHCKKHGELLGMKNVVSKQCEIADCNTQPNFGLLPKKATHCKKHGEPLGMKNVSNRQCEIFDCNTQPSFGLKLNKATHCQKHGESLGMKDVVSKRCETCESTTMNSKYKPNCAACHFYLNPDDPRIRNYKTKEQAFMSPLQNKYPEMILDRVVVGGCSKRRPDGLLDCLTHSVIIEIDEDRHVGYESICDNKRTMELFVDLGNRPIVFVRLNPDAYTLDNKRYSGVFCVSKGGTLTQNHKEFDRRYACLLGTVESTIVTIPSKEVTTINLYYSE